MSPVQRSLKNLRDRGFLCAIVERWNPYAKVRQDVFGFGDLLIAGDPFGPTLVQVTTSASAAARRAKIHAEPKAKLWKAAGGMILLHGWAKRGPRGKRKTWQVTEEIL